MPDEQSGSLGRRDVARQREEAIGDVAEGFALR